MLTNVPLQSTQYKNALSTSPGPTPAVHGFLQSNRQVGDSDWPGSKSRYIAAKAHLFSEGDTKTHLYQVVSGGFCLYRMLKDGRRQVFDFAFDGDVVGLGAGRVETCNAQAMTTTRARCLPIPAMLTAAETNGRVALGLYEALSRELAVAQAHLVCLGHRGAIEKLATFLVMLSRRNEHRGLPPDVINLPMSRADIADFLGITVETVSRSLTKLRVQGLIEIDKITALRLPGITRLVALAEGCERV